jgi:hypothetical protein
MMTNAYTATRGRAPENLKITSLTVGNVFKSYRDWIVCAETTETRDHSTTDQFGQVIDAVGSKFTDRFISTAVWLERENQWGAVLYRRVEGNGRGPKIGAASTHEFCSPSDRY